MDNLTPFQTREQSLLQLLQNASDPEQILSNIALKLGQIFQADLCLILGKRELNQRSLLGVWGLDNNQDEIIRKLLSNPLIKNAFQDEQTIILSDVETNSLNLNIQSLIIQPSKFQQEINGLILIGYTQIDSWSVAETELLKNLSLSIAIALSNLQLQQQNQIYQKHQNLINEITQSHTQTTNIDQIFQLSLAGMGKILAVDRGFLLMLKYQEPLIKNRRRQDPKATVNIIAQWSIDPQLFSLKSQDSFNLSECFLCQNALKNAPQCFPVEQLQEFIKNAKPKKVKNIFQPETFNSTLMIPLTRNSGDDHKSSVVLGFLVFQHHQTRHWYQDEIELARWISAQISTAIINNQSLTRIQSLVEERTSQLKWSLDVQSKLSEKMRQQIEQLRQLNQLKDEFMSSMSHELRTPLATMKMAIKMLRQTGSSPEKQARYLDILEQEWNREHNLIQDLLTLQQLESSQYTLNLEELNLREIITNLQQSFLEKWQPEKGLNLVIDHQQTEGKISTDVKSFNYIINELLTNAGKYAHSNTTITLEINRIITLEGQYLKLVITNYGVGILPEEKPYIFDKFRRGKGVTDRAVPGTGLGLALVKSLVQNLNGTIEVISEPTEQSNLFKTQFTVQFPL